MAIELESQALFANYFENQNSSAEGSVEATQETSADATFEPAFQSEEDRLASNASVQTWMIVIACVFAILGLSGVVGGLYSMKSQVDYEAAEIMVSRMAQYSQEAQLAAGIMAEQVKLGPWIYTLLGFRILLGFCCFGVAAAIKKRADHANNLALLVLAGILLYNVCLFGLTFVTTNNALNAIQIDPQAAQIAGTVALAFAAAAMFVKIAAYCGLSYYLSRPSVGAWFAPTRNELNKI